MRRFHVSSGVIIFTFVWLLVWLIAPLHETFPVNKFIAGRGPSYADANALARRFPNDPRVLAMQVQENFFDDFNGNNTGRIERQLAQFDALIRRFPRENWLRAERLIFVMGQGIDMDFEGAPHRRKRVLDAEILRGSLQSALEAEKIEPRNAFFPWMEAIFRFGLKQNDAGIAALQKAARAPQWNDYVTAGIRQRLAVISLDHVLGFEEKISVYVSANLQHTQKMSDACRAAQQIALDAQKRGDNRRALQVLDAIFGAVRAFRQGSDQPIEILIADAMMGDSLKRINAQNGLQTLKIEGVSLPQRRENSISMARDFGAYARQNGREDVANRALEVTQLPSSAALFENLEFWDEFGLKSPWNHIALSGPWFCFLMAAAAWVFAALWAASQLALMFWNWKSREISGKNAVPTRGNISRAANFAVWAMLGYGALLVQYGIGNSLESNGLYPQGNGDINGEIIRDLLSKSPLLVLLGAWLVPVAWAIWTRHYIWHRPTSRLPPRAMSERVKWLRRALWIGTVTFFAIAWIGRRGLFDSTFLALPRPIIVAAVCALAAIGVEFWLGRLFLWPRSGRFEKRSQPHSRRCVAHLASASAGVLAVVWSLFFLVGALGLWPLRAQLNRTLEHRVEIGEIAWQREQSALRKQASTVAVP